LGLPEHARDRVSQFVRMPMVIVGVVLLIVCANIAGMMLARGEGRASEIGVRLALGASPAGIVRDVIAGGVRLGGLGVLIGLAAAFLLTRMLRGLLYGVGHHDPTKFVAVPALLLAATLAACWLPARRAARVDPARTLRGE
ncbi:MAG: FtsX-like permease family protein, partial [Longimicrobiales bacterium]